MAPSVITNAASEEALGVHLVTLGCARNEVDSEQLAGQLVAGGFRLVAEPEAADAVLVNTCGFIEAAKKDSVDTLLAAADLKVSGRAQAVVAVGCLAERYGHELASAMPEADAVLGFDDYADIAGRLRRVVAGERPVAHGPRDRRRLLPLAPAERPARRRPPTHSWAPPDRGRVRGTLPTNRWSDRTTQDRLGLRPALHLLRDPDLPRGFRLPVASGDCGRGTLAGRPRRSRTLPGQ